MTLTPEQTRTVLRMIADGLTGELRPALDELQLLTVGDVAKLLKVAPDTAKRLLGSYVDLGERGARVSLAAVDRLIQDRTVRAK